MKPDYRTAATGIGVSIIAGLFLTQTSVAGDLHTLLDDPAAARLFDYCAWVYAEEETDDALPDAATILADSRGVAAGTTLASAIYIDAGIRTANAASSKKQCRRDFDKGTKQFAKALKKQAGQSRRNGGYQAVDDEAIAVIQGNLSRLWIRDQAARATYVRLQTTAAGGAEFWAHRLAVAETVLVDYEAANYMETLLSEYDWVDKQRFGVRSSRQAWLLVQHADDFPELQKLALERMALYLDSEQIQAGDYAYLWDRVAVNSGQLQRFGTQPDWQCKEGKLTLHPLEEPEKVDERRARMGLGPVAIDLAEMERNTCL